MADLLLQMALYGLAAAAVAPIAIVVGALVLGRSKRPVASVWTFAAGAFVLDALIVNIAWAVFGSADLSSGGDASAIIDTVLGTLFLTLGVVAVFAHDSPEKDAARRARADRVATAPLATMFVPGVLVQIINADAIAVFASRQVEIATGTVLGAIFPWKGVSVLA
jgi:hypothetical protein